MDEEYIKSICKPGQLEKSCRYLVVGANGFECAKLTSLRVVIDHRVYSGQFTAKGDNCDGIEQN